MTSTTLVAPKAAPTPTAKHLAPALMIIGFAAAWALVERIFGADLRRPYDVTEIVWWRYGTHLIIVFALWGWRQPARLWSTTRPLFHVGRSLLMLVMPISFVLAIRGGMPANTAVSIMWLAPALILAAHAYCLANLRCSRRALRGSVVNGCEARMPRPERVLQCVVEHRHGRSTTAGPSLDSTAFVVA